VVKSVPRLRYRWVSQSEPLWIALITQVLKICTRLHVSASRVTWASSQVLLSVIWFFALSRRDLPSSERKVKKIGFIFCSKIFLNSYWHCLFSVMQAIVIRQRRPWRRRDGVFIYFEGTVYFRSIFRFGRKKIR